MKIAFIVDAFPVLSETFILNQITGLLDLGHEVEIFTQRNSRVKKIHSDVFRYNLMQRVYYPVYEPLSLIKRWVKAALSVLLRANVKDILLVLRTLDIFKFGWSVLDLKQLYRIIPFLGRNNFDIIHCHFGPNGNYGALLKELGIKGKLVTTFHGYDLSKYVKQKGEDIYQDLFLKGDLFLPISSYWRNKLIQLGCPKEKIITHHMGIDIEKFKFRPRQLSTGEKLTILTIARLTEKKGLDYSIRAIAEIVKHKPNIEYDIIGDGSWRDRLYKLITELGVEEKIQLLGWKDSSEVRRLMKEAHIYVLSSITAADGNMEGIPVSLMEAQATGLPVVSTLHSGIPELVIDGKTGFLVSERNVNALAERLSFLIQHPETWQKMGQAGRKFVEKNFDIKKLNRKLAGIYQRVIDKRGH